MTDLTRATRRITAADVEQAQRIADAINSHPVLRMHMGGEWDARSVIGVALSRGLEAMQADYVGCCPHGAAKGAQCRECAAEKGAVRT